MLHFSKSDEESNSSTSWMAWGWGHFQQIFSFGWTVFLRIRNKLVISDTACVFQSNLSMHAGTSYLQHHHQPPQPLPPTQATPLSSQVPSSHSNSVVQVYSTLPSMAGGGTAEVPTLGLQSFQSIQVQHCSLIHTITCNAHIWPVLNSQIHLIFNYMVHIWQRW